MASIEFIQKRITGKEKELDKLTKKLERIRKAESFNYDDDHNPYLYDEYDLKRCLKDITAAQKALDDYRAQLTAETEKANSRNVQVIIDFLEMWKEECRSFYIPGLKAYFADRKAVKDAFTVAYSFAYGSTEHREAYERAEAISKQFTVDRIGKYEHKTFINRWGKEDSHEVKVRDGKYEKFAPYTRADTLEDAIAKLESDLIQEANRKYDFIIERTNAIVGTITDASCLEIGEKHDLNGYIIGTKGTAKVQTIGAGGYNIQCFHFRTLINKMN